MPKPRVTMQNIADKLGLSLKAVSDGINGTGHLSQPTRERLLAAVRETGYRRNSAARSLASRSSQLLGVLMPYADSSFFGSIVAGIERRVLNSDFMLLQGNIRGGSNILRDHIRRFAERDVEGVIVYPNQTVKEVADDLLALDVPIVQVMEPYAKLGTAVVMINNEEAGRQAARYLRELGHTRIGLLTHKRTTWALDSRCRGFLEELNYEVPEEECLLSIADSYIAAQRLLAAHPELTAIFATSDFAALGVLQAGLEMGRRIPDELAVIGFDNLDIAAHQLLYPLTTFAQPKEEIGEIAGEMLLSRLRGEPISQRILEAPLIIRTSTQRSPMTENQLTKEGGKDDVERIVGNIFQTTGEMALE